MGDPASQQTPPKCKCGEVAAQRTVKKDGPNQGRAFWGCPRFPDDSACNFFKWCQPQAQPQRPPGGSPLQQQPSPMPSPGQWWPSQQTPGRPPQQGGYPGQKQQQQQQQQQGGWQQSPQQQGWQQRSPQQQGRQQRSPQQQGWQQQQPWGSPGQRPPPFQQQSPGQSPLSAQPSPQVRGLAQYASPAGQGGAGGGPGQNRAHASLWQDEEGGGRGGGQGGSQGWQGGSQQPYSQPPQQQQYSQQQYSQPAASPQSQQGWGPGAGPGSPASWYGPPPGSQQSPPGSQYMSAHGSQQSPQQMRAGQWGGGGAAAAGFGSPGGSQQGPAVRGPDGMIHGGQGPGLPIRVNLQVADGDSFGASFRYNEALKDYIKSLRGPVSARWNPDARMWVFSRWHYDEVVRALQAAPVPIIISPLPDQDVMQQAEAAQSEFHLPEDEVEGRLARLPRELWERLYRFQREGVRRGVQMGGRCLIADEMGLGKTVQALLVAACFAQEDWPLLIICPATMKLVWEDAVRSWLPPEWVPRQRNLVVIKDGASMERKLEAMDRSTSARVVIVSYDLAKKLEGSWAAAFKTVICDESHLLKTQTTQRTKAVSTLVRAAPRAILCTGTPALSRPIELYAQINMLRPGLFGSVQEFGMRYCDGCPSTFPGPFTIRGMDYKGSSNLQELNQRLEGALMIRRLKQNVLDDLPEKIKKRILVEVDSAHKAGLDETLRAMRRNRDDERAGIISREEAQMTAQRLATEHYRKTGPAKARAAAAHVRELLDAGEKILIFAHHQSVLDEIQRLALQGGAVLDEEEAEDEGEDDAAGGTPGAGGSQAGPSSQRQGGGRKRGLRERTKPVPFIRIDGQVSNEKRKELVDRFQRNPSVRAALLSITAAGVGITLTEASVVVFAELYFNPGSLIQAEDRAHRMGQKGDLEVHYLVAPGTADDTLWETCKQKLAVVGSALGQEGAEDAFAVPSTQDNAPGQRRASLSPSQPGRREQQEQQQEWWRQEQDQRQQQQQEQQQEWWPQQQGGDGVKREEEGAGHSSGPASASREASGRPAEPEVVVISDSREDESEGGERARRKRRRAGGGAPP